MSADLSFRKCDFFSASNLFHKLLMQKPNYWLALARMIEVKRRMAALKDVVTYLHNAAVVGRSDSGLAYCTGVRKFLRLHVFFIEKVIGKITIFNHRSL